MRIKQTLEFEIETRVVREEEQVLIVVTGIDSDGGPFHTPRDIEEMNDPGFEGLDEDEHVYDVIDLEQVPEGFTDEQILDAYFNSPYGVA